MFTKFLLMLLAGSHANFVLAHLTKETVGTSEAGFTAGATNIRSLSERNSAAYPQQRILVTQKWRLQNTTLAKKLTTLPRQVENRGSPNNFFSANVKHTQHRK